MLVCIAKIIFAMTYLNVYGDGKGQVSVLGSDVFHRIEMLLLLLDSPDLSLARVPL